MTRLLFALWVMVLNALTAAAVAQDVAQLDLRDRSWGQGEVHSLDTEWSLYWGRLLTPEMLEEAQIQAESFPVPGLWNQPKQGQPQREAFGHGTLALTVRVPDGVGPVYLRIPDVPSAYRLWINGRRVADNGVPGEGVNSEQPNFFPQVVSVEAVEGQLRLVLQISNYHYKEGGIWHSFRLSDTSGRYWLYEVPLVSDVFVFAILFTIGVYHLAIYGMRRQEKAALYFGLFCLVVGMRGLLVGQRLFYLLEVGGWSLLQRQEHLLFFASLPLFALFYRTLFPQEVKWRFVATTLTIALVFMAATLVLPVHWFARLTTPYQFVMMASAVYMAWVYRRVWREQRPGAGLFGLSFAILFVAFLHDLAYTHFLLNTSPVIHFGVVGFIITQAALLNRRYVRSLQLVEEMSSELRRRNQDLEQINRLKDDFLATTSHELRTPLHGIAGLADLLLSDDSHQLTPSQQQQVELIAASAKRLGGLVNDILDFAAIKHGSLHLKLQPTDLDTIARLVLSSVKPLLLGKRVELQLEIDANAKFVLADENRLQQVLYNLVGNAIKFTEEGSIAVSARMRGNRVAITVSDTGIGIPAEKIELLFRPFEPIELDAGAQWGSSGLGLTICRQLVERQGGTLSIDSEPGQGTRVTFDLARADAIEPSHDDEPETAAAERSGLPVPVERKMVPEQAAGLALPMRADSPMDDSSVAMRRAPVADALVFVVDDDEVNRQLLRQQLERAGYRVECFPSGRLVLQQLAEMQEFADLRQSAEMNRSSEMHQTTGMPHAAELRQSMEKKQTVTELRPDLIILDLMMPQMNGFQVCERIRSDYNSYELPIMMLTARHQIGDIVHALALGANDYLFKPHHPRELLARVESLVGQRRFWVASLENELLREEIERRREAENGLRLANQRLVRLLDCSTDAILLTDDLGVVLYANQACRHLWQTPSAKLAGQELDALLGEPLTARLEQLSRDREVLDVKLNIGQGLSSVGCHLRCGLIEFEDHCFFALILNPIPETPALPAAQSLLLQLSTELGESRRRIETLEDVLRSVAGNLPNGTEPLPQAETDVRPQLVELLRLSLSLWERYSGKGKIDLAEETRCWRVYLDGGTAKTRTLDKYLSVKTLPEKPRWRLVVRTANFVRDRCPLTEDEQHQIEVLVQLLESAYL